MVPSQYSRLFVCRLKPKVPGFGFFGLSGVFQEAMVGRPIIIDKPWPRSINNGEELFAI